MERRQKPCNPPSRLERQWDRTALHDRFSNGEYPAVAISTGPESVRIVLLGLRPLEASEVYCVVNSQSFSWIVLPRLGERDEQDGQDDDSYNCCKTHEGNPQLPSSGGTIPPQSSSGHLYPVNFPSNQLVAISSSDTQNVFPHSGQCLR